MNSISDYSRYQKQILLKEFGKHAQDKLNASKTLVIGAGGLGCPALLYLAAAGAGTIGIVDYDIVDISNLQRQVLYTMNDIGKLKVQTASFKLLELNPEIKINVHNIEITNQNALDIISKYDIVIDGTDNFFSRYLINDACVILNKPLVYGALLRFEGQVGVFNLFDKKMNFKTNYRDLFPQPPESSAVLSCNDTGVLGVLPGIIGTMQAAEAIKIITGIGKPLINKIISYNALENTFYDFQLTPDSKLNQKIPIDKDTFTKFDYRYFCNSRSEYEITAEEFESKRLKEHLTIIDVRDSDELPIVNEFDYVKITMDEFEKEIHNIPQNKVIVIYCQSGIRSLNAVKILKDKFPQSTSYSLKGGIENWKKYISNSIEKL